MSDDKELDRLFLNALAAVKKMSPKEAKERLYAHGVSPFGQTRLKSVKDIPKRRQYFDDPHEWEGYGFKRSGLSTGDRIERIMKIDPLAVLTGQSRREIRTKKRGVPYRSITGRLAEEMQIKRSLLRARRKGKI